MLSSGELHARRLRLFGCSRSHTDTSLGREKILKRRQQQESDLVSSSNPPLLEQRPITKSFLAGSTPPAAGAPALPMAALQRNRRQCLRGHDLCLSVLHFVISLPHTGQCQVTLQLTEKSRDSGLKMPKGHCPFFLE